MTWEGPVDWVHLDDGWSAFCIVLDVASIDEVVASC